MLKLVLRYWDTELVCETHTTHRSSFLESWLKLVPGRFPNLPINLLVAQSRIPKQSSLRTSCVNGKQLFTTYLNIERVFSFT